MVSIIGLGGFHIGHQEDERESIRIMRTAIDNGINFMDNCWDYNQGASESRMAGEVLGSLGNEGRALKDIAFTVIRSLMSDLILLAYSPSPLSRADSLPFLR
jgi:diketogulonate reductase-like aldo/keto reductase